MSSSLHLMRIQEWYDNTDNNVEIENINRIYNLSDYT